MQQNRVLMTVITMSILLAGQGYTQDVPENGGFEGGKREMASRRSARQQTNRGANMQNEMLFRLIKNPRIAQEIGLTDEKAQALKDAFLKVQMTQIDLEAERDKLHLQHTGMIAEIMSNREKKGDDAIKILEEIGEINTKLSKLTIDRILAIRENLTDEQLQKAREAVQNQRKEMREAIQKRGGVKGREDGADRPRERRPRQNKAQD